MIQQIIHLKKGNNYQLPFNRLVSRFFFIPLFVALVITGCQTSGPIQPDGGSADIPPLIYTKHARCRMECRHINEAEIKEVLAENNINNRKSNPEGKPCPAYAYEGYSKEHQHLRIIIGKCDDHAWKVITCIDLGNEFECDCH